MIFFAGAQTDNKSSVCRFIQRCLQIYILCMIALADGRDFVFILLRSCGRINKYGPKTKDQKEKCWLNVRQTHLKTENRSKSLLMS